jgi:hypothetical protein
VTATARGASEDPSSSNSCFSFSFSFSFATSRSYLHLTLVQRFSGSWYSSIQCYGSVTLPMWVAPSFSHLAVEIYQFFELWWHSIAGIS